MRIRALTAAALLTSTLGLLFAGSAGATITVANGNDSGPGSLREAVATAPAGEVIVLPAGTYTLSSGTLEIKKSLTIEGHSSADTTVRAGGNFGVIAITGPGEVNLEDMTIRDGNIVGAGGSGAGIFSVSADLSLHHVSVTHNTINANGAPGSQGGAATGVGLFFVGPSLEIFDSSVSENSALVVGGSGKSGGAVSGGGVFAVLNSGRLRIANSTVSGNVADARGGQGPANAEQAGGAVSGGGYFIVANSTSSSRVDGSTFANNSADVSGGPGGENGALSGAGIFEVNNSAPMTYSNVTVAANVAKLSATGGAVSGGGIFTVANQPVSLFNATISSNRIDGSPTTSFGGDAYLINKVFLKNSIIANGSGPAGSENCFLAGGPTSLGFNIDSRNQCEFKAAGDKVNTDPLLGPLQDNGGPTLTMAPAGNSPAVDQGNSVGLFDQRGVVRPIDFPSIANAPGSDGSDIGAVELQPSNAFALGKITKNKRKGTATVAVTIPTPSVGTLTLSGSGLKKQTVAITGQASAKLKVVAKGGAAKSLRKKGKKKVKFEVIYAPTANAAATKSRSTTLKRKHRAKRKR